MNSQQEVVPGGA